MKILCTLPFAIKLGLLCIAVGIVIGLYLSERALAYPVLDTRDLSCILRPSQFPTYSPHQA
jgi:hypothetical protein